MFSSIMKIVLERKYHVTQLTAPEDIIILQERQR
jgi:hypothetical protein